MNEIQKRRLCFALTLFAVGGGGNAGILLAVPEEDGAEQDRQRMNYRDQIVSLYKQMRLPLYRHLLCIGVSARGADDIIQESFLLRMEPGRPSWPISDLA